MYLDFDLVFWIMKRGAPYVWRKNVLMRKYFYFFLQQVLVQYLEGKIVIILDNARIHHVKLIQPF
ncbi:hypothetical protein COI83_25175 [Bacillus cereus]|nr:hypothetical protein COI83_25175 [Bacillus cereus]